MRLAQTTRQGIKIVKGQDCGSGLHIGCWGKYKADVGNLIFLHSLAATDICTMPEYQIAHICFVFSPTSNVQPRSTILALDNLYSFVFWLEPISSPLPHSRFRTVQKMKVGGQQATGVVCLTDI